MSDSWRFAHKRVIDSFLDFLNNKTDKYILKCKLSLNELIESADAHRSSSSFCSCPLKEKDDFEK